MPSNRGRARRWARRRRWKEATAAVVYLSASGLIRFARRRSSSSGLAVPFTSSPVRQQFLARRGGTTQHTPSGRQGKAPESSPSPSIMDPFDPDAIIHVLSRCEACQLGQVSGSSVFVSSQDQCVGQDQSRYRRPTAGVVFSLPQRFAACRVRETSEQHSRLPCRCTRNGAVQYPVVGPVLWVSLPLSPIWDGRIVRSIVERQSRERQKTTPCSKIVIPSSPPSNPGQPFATT